MTISTPHNDQFRMLRLLAAVFISEIFIFWLVLLFIVKGLDSGSAFSSLFAFRLAGLLVSIAVVASIPALKSRLRNNPDLPKEQSFCRAEIVSFAVAELPVIFGVVLVILGRNLNEYYLFAFISLIAFMQNCPNKQQWKEFVQV